MHSDVEGFKRSRSATWVSVILGIMAVLCIGGSMLAGLVGLLVGNDGSFAARPFFTLAIVLLVVGLGLVGAAFV